MEGEEGRGGGVGLKGENTSVFDGLISGGVIRTLGSGALMCGNGCWASTRPPREARTTNERRAVNKVPTRWHVWS